MSLKGIRAGCRHRWVEDCQGAKVVVCERTYPDKEIIVSTWGPYPASHADCVKDELKNPSCLVYTVPASLRHRLSSIRSAVGRFPSL